jgi:hypothetical protein
MHLDLRGLYGGSTDRFDITTSSSGVDDLAVIIDLKPATAAADVRIYIRRYINYVCVCSFSGAVFPVRSKLS